MEYSCMDNCIHLRACRRLQQIARKRFCGIHIARKCDKECSSYETIEDICAKNNYYSIAKVQEAIDGATNDTLNGYTDNIVSDYLVVR